MKPNINVNVCGCNGISPYIYKTIVLKPNMVKGKNVLTQDMMSCANTKYVIIHNYVIDRKIVCGKAKVQQTNVSHCPNPDYAKALADYNNAHDAWIDADNAYTNNPNDTTLAAKNTAYAAYIAAQEVLNNTPQFYYYDSTPVHVNAGEHVSIPKGCVLLNENLNGVITFGRAAHDMNLFIGSATPAAYDYKITEAIEVPEECIIEFDGGSIDSGTIIGQDTLWINVGDVDVWGENLERIGTWREKQGGGSITDKEYDPDHFSGYGRKTLQLKGDYNNVLTQDDFNQEHTIYVISYDFDLDRQEITLPEGCILDFEGGSISNGTMNLQQTLLLGNPRFDAIDFNGTIENDMFDVTWIISGDIGAKINAAQENFKCLFVPEDEYTLTTPVVLEAVERLESNAVFRFNGTYKNCEGIFLIQHSVSAKIDFNKLTPFTLSGLDYTGNRSLNMVGIEIRSCNNCVFSIQSVGYFNENIRVSDTDGSGCCYNHFYIQESNNGNANVRIYQHKEGSGVREWSWCNENTFDGGRFTHYTSNKVDGGYAPVPWFDPVNLPYYTDEDHNNCSQSFYNRYVAAGLCFDPHDFIMGGPALDLDSYLPIKPRDDYDSVNAIIIQNTSMEKSWNPVVARNARFKMINNRAESNPYTAKLIGACLELDYTDKYGDVIKFLRSDVTECTWLNFTNRENLFGAPSEICLANNVSKYSNYVYYANDADGLTIRNSASYKGIIVDVSTYNMLSITRNTLGRFVIMYLDDNGANITASYSSKAPSHASMYRDNSGNNDFYSSQNLLEDTFFFPNETNRVFIGVGVDDDVESVEIYTVHGTLQANPSTSAEYDKNIPINMSVAPDSGHTLYSYGEICLCDALSPNLMHVTDNTGRSIGVIIDTSIIKRFNVTLYDSQDVDITESKGNASIMRYLTDDAMSLQTLETEESGQWTRLYAPNRYSHFNGVYKGYMYAAHALDDIIPDFINKVFVGILATAGMEDVKKIKIASSEGAVQIVNIIPTSGTTESRPPSGKAVNGMCYLDIQVGKPIWWLVNETYPSGTWVDATGTTIV